MTNERVTRKPTVGQTLWMLNVGNAARRDPQALTPVVVEKVGRKWFTVNIKGSRSRYDSERFSLDGWEQDNGGHVVNYTLYTCPNDWQMEQEAKNLWNRIRAVTDHYTRPRLSLTCLRGIVALIDKETTGA